MKKNKELLIEVSATSRSPFTKDLINIYTWLPLFHENEKTVEGIVEGILERYSNKYPGNYVLEEYLDSKLLKVQYRLRFETPEDKTMFLLRYD